MDKLPHPLLLEILSRLDNSADVARCRVASKAFDDVSPYLRSINLRYSRKWFWDPSNPFKRIFLDLISKQKTVESVNISLYDGYMYDVDSAKEWMPRVSKSLKSLSLSSLNYHCGLFKPNIMPLISSYCNNLVNLELICASSLLVTNLNPMPMLTSLTLSSTILEDEQLNGFNKCFPNLQHLKLVDVRGLEDAKIHLLNLQTCHLFFFYNPPPFTLITPNLISLRIESFLPATIHVEAPMLSHFHLRLNALQHGSALTAEKFEKLKTLWLRSLDIGSLLSKFPITKTVENLTLDAPTPIHAIDSKLTLRKVFMVFPNVTSLCIKSSVWSELEACLNPEGWEILDGRKGLKTICAYLMLDDPSLTFSFVAFVLDQCEGLTEVSLLIHSGVDGTKSNSFMSKCMARWPGLKWRWGVWREGMKDTWGVQMI